MGGTQKGCKRQNYAHVSFWTTPIIQIFLPFKREREKEMLTNW
ncbi:hypothetical protein COLO4_11635 [Corchorus olitorius]|uniref:Uncharacterized protein n=1 Tax=Corchorus olitorius TaxID=93759 RepID=A0A1R3K3Q9_9ROSI|nr:hypothetical protein COLO4_11635 [Corchorus olitorius]